MVKKDSISKTKKRGVIIYQEIRNQQQRYQVKQILRKRESKYRLIENLFSYCISLAESAKEGIRKEITRIVDILNRL